MDKCPYEVLLRIFKLACDDDGMTGRSLSLVSRTISLLSKEHKLQSIAVTGTEKLVPFATMLSSLPQRYRRVRHMFIATMAQHRSPSTEGDSKAYIGELPYDEIWSTYTHIMQMVAPTLVTCTLVNHFPRTTTLLPVSCPNLVDLKLQGPFPVLFYPHETPLFPSLRSITFSTFTDHPVYLFDDISTQAPSVENLAFYPAQPSRCLHNDLCVALGIQPNCNCPCSSAHLEALSNATLPSSVAQITVQPGPHIAPHARNASCLRNVQDLMRRKIRHMQKHDERNRVKLAPPSPAPANEQELLQWLQ